MEAHLRTRGLIDKDAEKRVEQEQTSIEENLADFEKSLRARKATEKHIKLTVSRIRKIVNGCEFQRLSDLKADDVELPEGGLLGKLEAKVQISNRRPPE